MFGRRTESNFVLLAKSALIDASLWEIPCKTCANPQERDQDINWANLYENEMVQTYCNLNSSQASPRLVEFKGVALMTVLTVLTALEVLQNTLPSFRLSYQTGNRDGFDGFGGHGGFGHDGYPP